MGLWGRDLPARHGIGLAAHYSFLTYVAMAMHVSVDEGGTLAIHEVDCAIDCGQVVNPSTVMAQMEGATIFGLTGAVHGAITVKDGAVEQGNFNDYPMMRIGEAPHVNVRIIPSEMAPTGIGEPGVPPVAPALSNAIFAATGKRIRDLPVTGQNLV
jgi:isoquinoline 1-oxidoreductase beta subunit